MIDKHAGPTSVGAALIALAALGGLAAAPAAAAGSGAETIIRNTCGTCHTETGEGSGQFSRISQQRKTPEGWQVTINRMEHLRGLRLSAEDKRTVIKYLADTRGLAPSEAAPYRYLLEQDTNRVETVSPDYAQMCARCHSGARFGLQRRSEEEWQLLVQFHVAQHPTLEFHSLSRDRPWFRLAMNHTSAQLVKDFPLATDAWRKWQAAPKPALGGDWHLVGYVPGKGEFAARMRAEPAGKDQFRLAVDGRYADGSPLRGTGSAIVFTGYEWRGTLDVDGERLTVTAVSVGNPHCVIFTDRLDEALVRRVGPRVENHPAFPNRINVQWARVASRSQVDILIWERGAGWTLGYGSSSSAVACAAVRNGLCDQGLVTVRMPGGELAIDVRPDWSVRLKGAVEEVYTGTLTPGFIATLHA